mmetsp:Transcript_1741/g.5609  ORF Transcript_1741/g.5609 Transcript_1741/m.5609 type:complete len:211 (-) Transcript_1741:858-1490(-)
MPTSGTTRSSCGRPPTTLASSPSTSSGGRSSGWPSAWRVSSPSTTSVGASSGSEAPSHPCCSPSSTAPRVSQRTSSSLTRPGTRATSAGGPTSRSPSSAISMSCTGTAPGSPGRRTASTASSGRRTVRSLVPSCGRMMRTAPPRQTRPLPRPAHRRRGRGPRSSLRVRRARTCRSWLSGRTRSHAALAGPTAATAGTACGRVAAARGSST